MSKSRNTSRRAAGFTLVEVVVAMGVMVIGVMAVVGLQTHTVHVNSLSRQMSTASQIAQTWLERFKQDAQRWNEPGVVPGAPSPIAVLAATQWLQQVNAAPGRFQSVPVTPTTSGMFDFQGNEILLNMPGAPPPYFCVGYKPNWVWVGRSIRIDVRVFWPRDRTGAVVNCLDDDVSLSPGGLRFSQFHTTYLSTVINHTRVIR